VPLPAAAVHVRERLVAVFGGSVGNLLEWYDWYVYSALSLYFAKVFFPGGDRTAQLLSTAAVFAVGFFVRPLGGWIFGRYADRHGRKAALTLSVLLMCAGSLLIAVTPGYASIGIAAPALLILARVLQGFSVGGEFGASATYLAEMAPPRRRGFYSSFQHVTLILGQLLAIAVLLLLQLVLTPRELDAWGWRIPFVLGALAAVIAFWLRRRLAETESFVRAGPPARGAGAVGVLLRENRREVLVVIGLTMGGTVAFYTYTTYMQKFLVNTVGLDTALSTQISAATLSLYLLLQPLVGALSDRIGRRPPLIAFGILGTLATVPLLRALEHARSASAAFVLIMAALVIVTGYTAVSAVVKAELFPVQIRTLGVSLPYAFAVSLFGGTAEYVALWCKSIGQEQLYYYYVAACIACSLVVYATMREPRRTASI
jgi:MFS transporter, MHS family, alpha-ketoglutarate permease